MRICVNALIRRFPPVTDIEVIGGNYFIRHIQISLS